ncbi:MAG TPA: trypsin-like serine protease [Gaiellaceae bacterium]
MLRRLVLLAGVAALVAAAPALSITGGSLDGNAHPAVGLILADGGSGPAPDCTGSLVSRTVVVTAAHCVHGATAWVTFDSHYVAGSSKLVTGTFHADPLWDPAAKDTHDLAVVVLDKPVQVQPLPLPAAGVLDVLPKDATVTNVGYGYFDRTFTFDGYRRVSTSSFTSVGASLLKLSDNPGGVCFGDSGGPRLFGGAVVAVTSTGNANCTGQSVSYRLDTQSARSFLSGFVPVP